jgi:hypothetical protein
VFSKTNIENTERKSDIEILCTPYGREKAATETAQPEIFAKHGIAFSVPKICFFLHTIHCFSISKSPNMTVCTRSFFVPQFHVQHNGPPSCEKEAGGNRNFMQWNEKATVIT